MGDVVVPRTRTLQLSRGRFIVVREELSHGEFTAMNVRKYRETDEGRLRLNAELFGDAEIVAYLVDWNMLDSRDQIIAIRDLPPDDVQAVLNNLRQPVLMEVKRAIEAHADAVAAAGEEQKKTASIESSLPPTSPSVAIPA